MPGSSNRRGLSDAYSGGRALYRVVPLRLKGIPALDRWVKKISLFIGRKPFPVRLLHLPVTPALPVRESEYFFPPRSLGLRVVMIICHEDN